MFFNFTKSRKNPLRPKKACEKILYLWKKISLVEEKEYWCIEFNFII